jgi:hypothetical protein
LYAPDYEIELSGASGQQLLPVVLLLLLLLLLLMTDSTFSP